MRRKKYIDGLLAILVFWISVTANGQCVNADFSLQNFTNWTGNTSVYPLNTPYSNIGLAGQPYYYNTGIVPGRHTIITTATPDPFTCGNVMTLPPGENQCVRLGNGGINTNPAYPNWTNGVGWERDFLSYTFSITPSNALLIYKYAVVLQDPTNDPNNPPHQMEVKPRFIVTIKNASGQLIDSVCGRKEDYADTTTPGYRNCTLADAQSQGGNAYAGGDIVYRAWTTVGVDLRNYINQNITIQFETWDCGMGGHFGYAYVTAQCDSMGIEVQNCNADGSVTLTAPPGFSYRWLPGGQTSQTIQLMNVQPGDTAYVELTTMDGCQTSLRTVLYPSIIQADFVPDDFSVCVGTPVHFSDSSSSMQTFDQSNVPIVNWQWSFDDGDSAWVQHPSHQFDTPGNYLVQLHVRDQNGCEHVNEKYVQVLPSPIANFMSNERCEGEAVSFSDLSQIIGVSGIISTWSWDFGDGSPGSDVPNPSHVYPNAGTYPVSLAITTDQWCAHDTTIMVKVWPRPHISFYSNSVCEGLPMVFENTSAPGDVMDPLSQWLWNFGDGSGFSSEEEPIHIYAAEGVYSVQLVGITNRGCVSNADKVIEVHGQPSIDFEAEPMCPGVSTPFHDLTPVSDSIIAWNWTFDDGPWGISSEQHPSYLYAQPGLYYPQLQVESLYGCKDSIIKPVQILALPAVNFEADKYSSCVPLCVSLTDKSFSLGDTIREWHWDFGDGQQVSAQHVLHCFTNPGLYDVSLEVVSQRGCVVSYTWEDMLEAYPIPQAAFVVSNDQLDESHPIAELNDVSDGGTEWKWDFGDGTGIFAQDTMHTYLQAGTFVIWQTVKNDFGCIDSVAQEVVIRPEWTFFVPNAFTPNGDGKNDGFIPKGYNIRSFRFWIFDRWGNMIYYTENVDHPWNGKVNNGINGETVAQEDVYVYKVVFVDVFGDKHEQKGTFTLVR